MIFKNHHICFTDKKKMKQDSTFVYDHYIYSVFDREGACLTVRGLRSVMFSYFSSIIAYLGALSLALVCAEDPHCSTFPYKKEAKDVLKVLGFTDSCISTSLELCDKNCQIDFSQSIRQADIEAQEAVALITKASERLKSLSSCLKDEFVSDEVSTNLPKPKDCNELKNSSGDQTSGIKTIYPYSCCPDRSLNVLCDQTTSGGGWTVFQKREVLPMREDFYRNWTEYANGFGNLTGEFWLGLDNIHEMTTNKPMILRIEMENDQGVKKYAEYANFKVGDAVSKYKLTVSGYSGDAGDSLSALNDAKFSTQDQDNDIHVSANCAVAYKGAWWYTACHASNLNGYQYVGKTTSYADGIVWKDFMGYHYSLSKVSMMIRPSG